MDADGDNMPRPSLRSRSLRKIKMRIPGSASVVHYLRRNPSKAKCANCGKTLNGVTSKRPIKMKKMAKTKKTVSRAFGGNLCPGCAKTVLKTRARGSG
jgi:large subunit ribosomal protein L34e